MTRSVSQKMGVREGSRAFLKNIPESAQDALSLPNDLQLSSTLVGVFDYIHCFTTEQVELNRLLPMLKLHLEPAGMLWVSWPKGKQLGTDLSLPEVIRISYNHGLVESICLSVDKTWSALKLTFPKKGKIYNNRYGKLPDAAPRKGGFPK